MTTTGMIALEIVTIAGVTTMTETIVIVTAIVIMTAADRRRHPNTVKSAWPSRSYDYDGSARLGRSFRLTPQVGTPKKWVCLLVTNTQLGPAALLLNTATMAA